MTGSAQTQSGAVRSMLLLGEKIREGSPGGGGSPGRVDCFIRVASRREEKREGSGERGAPLLRLIESQQMTGSSV